MNAWTIAEKIFGNDDNGEMSNAIDGIGERRSNNVKSSNGVARCLFVYLGLSLISSGKCTPCNIPSPSNLTMSILHLFG